MSHACHFSNQEVERRGLEMQPSLLSCDLTHRALPNKQQKRAPKQKQRNNELWVAEWKADYLSHRCSVLVWLPRQWWKCFIKRLWTFTGDTTAKIQEQWMERFPRTFPFHALQTLTRTVLAEPRRDTEDQNANAKVLTSNNHQLQ